MTFKPKTTGFTLIETLLAVLLLTTAIAGPLTIASRALTSATVAKNQITAFYLAQDAMEYVRFLRDSACLAAGDSGGGGCPRTGASNWLSSLSTCVSTDGSTSCYVDSLSTNPATPVVCSGTCPTMRYDSTNKVFNYNVGVSTSIQQFVRTVTIQYDQNGSTPDEAIVTVQVSWSDLAGVIHAPVTIRENLFRWQ